MHTSRSQLIPRLRNRCRRVLCQYIARRNFRWNPGRPVISFSFDDFPANALRVGGAILEDHGVRGTYYASLGLMGKVAPTGRIFDPEDLLHLVEAGHELGCHTFAHCHAWETPFREFAESVAENQTTLTRLCPGAVFQTLSYPISCPNPRIKRHVAGRFPCCRGGGQTLNAGSMDRNYVRAFFLEQTRGEIAPVRALITEASRLKAWLVFATHDIDAEPTPYGCTPAFFSEVVRAAVESGALVLPVAKAWQTLQSWAVAA